MPEGTEYATTNINGKWLDNIYENLKNLEMYERLAREGCTSILEYVQIPYEQRNIFLGDVQYKNLKFIATEISLLLTDLTPVIDPEKIRIFRVGLEGINNALSIRKLYLLESFSAKTSGVISVQLTKMFDETLKVLCDMRIEIITEIAPILYVKERQRR